MGARNPGCIISMAASESITAHRVVAPTTTDNEVQMWDTSSSNVLGVSHDFGESGGSVPVTITGTERVQCGASISTGAIVGPQTASGGLIVERTENTATAYYPLLGMALETGSTNSVIKVALNINNRTGGI